MEFVILHLFVSIGIFKFGEHQIFQWFGVLISFAEKIEAVVNIATGINEIFYWIAGSHFNSSIIILEDLMTIKNILNHMESSISFEFEGIEYIILDLDITTIIQNWKAELCVGVQTVNEAWEVFASYMCQWNSIPQSILEAYGALCGGKPFIELESFNQATTFCNGMNMGCSIRSHRGREKIFNTEQSKTFKAFYGREQVRSRNFMRCERHTDKGKYLKGCVLKNRARQYHWMNADSDLWGRIVDGCVFGEVMKGPTYDVCHCIQSVNTFSFELPVSHVEGKRQINHGGWDPDDIISGQFDQREPSVLSSHPQKFVLCNPNATVHVGDQSTASSSILNNPQRPRDLISTNAVAENVCEDLSSKHSVGSCQDLLHTDTKKFSRVNSTPVRTNSMNYLRKVGLLHQDIDEHTEWLGSKVIVLDVKCNLNNYSFKSSVIAVLVKRMSMMGGKLL